MYISGESPKRKESRLEIKLKCRFLISILRWCYFGGCEARPLLSNEQGVVNSPLLHSSWQETVLEDNLFTRQVVIARLDLHAQPRKYHG